MTTSPFLAPAGGGVLVASPNSSLREQVLLSLHDHRWQVQEASGGADALVKLETGSWQLLFLDRRLPDLDAEELITIIKRKFPGIEVVLMDSDSGQTIPARDPNFWQRKLNRATPRPESRAIGCTPSASEANPQEIEPLPGMIGRAEAMQRLYELTRLVAPRLTTVLVTGPTGSGKELVARAIHKLSPRASRPFAVVNCAAIPEALLESELFGYARGAFTGAVQTYSGRIHAAQGGTLFLDEIGELPLGLQAKLLRFLDLKEVQRLGSSDTVRADVRVVAATNVDLARAVEAGRFRSDLFYRLSAFPIQVPALRERSADIITLAQYFLAQIAAETQSERMELSAEAACALEVQPWEGNVRELQQVMERAVILACNEKTLAPQHFYLTGGGRTRPIAQEAAAGRRL